MPESQDYMDDNSDKIREFALDLINKREYNYKLQGRKEPHDPIMYAVQWRETEYIEALLSQGVSPESKDRHDKSAIDYFKMIEQGREKTSIYQIILKYFGSFDSTSDSGQDFMEHSN